MKPGDRVIVNLCGVLGVLGALVFAWSTFYDIYLSLLEIVKFQSFDLGIIFGLIMLPIILVGMWKNR